MVSTSRSYASHFPPLLFPSIRLICLVNVQGRSLPHSPGWARVPLSSFFPQISLIFPPQTFYPHFPPPGGRRVACLVVVVWIYQVIPQPPCFCEFYHVFSCCLRSVCSVSSELISHVNLGYKTLCDRSINYLFNIYLHFDRSSSSLILLFPTKLVSLP